MRQRFDDTRRPDPNLSQRLDARDGFAHADMDDTETLALIGDGHTFGMKHGDCRALHQPIQPLTQPGARGTNSH